MKGKKIHICLLIITLLMLQKVSAQTLSQEEISVYAPKTVLQETLALYELNHFRFIWNEAVVRNDFKRNGDSAAYYGLDSRNYSFSYLPGNTREDSLRAEIGLTANVIRFLKDLSVGRQPPEFRYDGIKFYPSAADIPPALYFAIHQRSIGSLIQTVQPGIKEYRLVIEKLRFYLQTISTGDFRDIRVASLKPDTSNHQLILRFKQTGITDPSFNILDNKELEKEIIKAQVTFNLSADGKIKSRLISALNVPLKKRVEELTSLINTIRWYNSLLKSDAVILINIPAAALTVYDKEERMLDSKVILGQRSTPTPTLTTVIDAVILYPYWYVPFKIATRELLPQIKKNIHFLERNNYQVLNKNSKIVNPNSINWQSLHSGYFPYSLRQATGCDNALGLVKFNFINPFSVFMHDTPGKNLFNRQQRFFSHGCIRVEQPTALTHILLGSNKLAADTLSEKGCLVNQKPIPVKPAIRANLVVLYNTAWVNPEGRIVFYEDIYKKLK